MPKKISTIRLDAFHHQGGDCFYCGNPMWLTHARQFARQHGLTKRQAKDYRCTAEHLIPRQDGGNSSPENIVAACIVCNHRRHHDRLAPLELAAYRDYVQEQQVHGNWHQSLIQDRQSG